jgi:hypothetical protein
MPGGGQVRGCEQTKGQRNRRRAGVASETSRSVEQTLLQNVLRGCRTEIRRKTEKVALGEWLPVRESNLYLGPRNLPMSSTERVSPATSQNR